MRKRTPIFLILLVLWGFSGVVNASQSLVLTPGTALSIAIPAYPPYTTLSDTRVEYRLHNWTTPTKSSKLFSLGGTVGIPFLVFQLNPTNELCVIDYQDALNDYGGAMCADITGVSDVVVRVQRDVTNLRLN